MRKISSSGTGSSATPESSAPETGSRRARSFRLGEAVILILILLVPAMLVLGRGEGTVARTPALFWVLLLLPLLAVPWVLRRSDLEEIGGTRTGPPRRTERDPTSAAALSADELAAASRLLSTFAGRMSRTAFR